MREWMCTLYWALIQIISTAIGKDAGLVAPAYSPPGQNQLTTESTFDWSPSSTLTRGWWAAASATYIPTGTYRGASGPSGGGQLYREQVTASRFYAVMGYQLL